MIAYVHFVWMQKKQNHQSRFQFQYLLASAAVQRQAKIEYQIVFHSDDDDGFRSFQSPRKKMHMAQGIATPAGGNVAAQPTTPIA